MIKFKKVLRICLALLSASILLSYSSYINFSSISVASGMRGLDFSFPFIFALSFAYLHSSLDWYLVPINKLGEPNRTLLYEASRCSYKNSFFNRTIFLGYLVMLVVAVIFVDVEFIRTRPEMRASMDGMILAAILLVSLGTFSKARGVTLYLLNEHVNQINHNDFDEQ